MTELSRSIRILALGGGASNALYAMICAGHDPAELIAANTDMQDLKRSPAPMKLHIGRSGSPRNGQ